VKNDMNAQVSKGCEEALYGNKIKKGAINLREHCVAYRYPKLLITMILTLSSLLQSRPQSVN
jgi:hypothetical protein